MNSIKDMMKLYAVTDRAWTGKQTLLEQTEAALRGGITCLQLREKNLSRDEILKEALEINDLCRSYNVPLIINDDPVTAVKSGADGVHIGQKDMSLYQAREITGKNMIIGVTAASPELAVKAERDGADYIGSGAVFGSTTKNDAKPLSHDILREICASVSIPVVAIGGINRNNILQLSGTGIAGTALVSAIFAAEDIENECRYLLGLSERIISGKEATV
ncbi:MAG: thiamine phosphate synthase [Oscillospiraceae bacterium]|nr:thiamine phosphate synthase [Oscillospiraceae bacterium]